MPQPTTRFAVRTAALVAALVTACSLPDPPPPRNCAVRTAFYPDADGDGLGEPTQVFIGCAAPDGWVATLASPSETGSSDTGSLDTGSTASP